MRSSHFAAEIMFSAWFGIVFLLRHDSKDFHDACALVHEKISARKRAVPTAVNICYDGMGGCGATTVPTGNLAASAVSLI